MKGEDIKNLLIVLFLVLAVGIISLVLVSAASADYPPNDATRASANAYAKKECGFAWNWICINPTQQAASCPIWYDGSHTRKCENVVREQSFDLRERYCWITTRWYHNGGLIYHYNTCRH